MQDIAKWIEDTKVLSRLTGIAAVCLTATTLSGCLGGLDFAGSTDVDRTVATSSVPSVRNDEDNSDAITVRNAVSSADVTRVDGNPIPWANSTSGSAGVISSISEEQVNGTTCRRFTTTRHSYQGIAKFDGNTCLMGNGEWYLTSFGPRS
ncbi:RT0821/Lpp0805 family surface protein [Pararhizobium sp. YC-54]|uniref:RT0821/Lpp0805 family surface protein n=1 Tax=Pararhizobium sp. YC-54 TaxID=2986920 RepID=UPI0021F7338B|nr:RT0821/Lpp0805 family surface protein [Pararhizobium sp. YC-54]MCW0000408.1 RT0821/Lpp0805 family surface protein [Pararhizobium sp. YC-54]